MVEAAAARTGDWRYSVLLLRARARVRVRVRVRARARARVRVGVRARARARARVKASPNPNNHPDQVLPAVVPGDKIRQLSRDFFRTTALLEQDRSNP